MYCETLAQERQIVVAGSFYKPPEGLSVRNYMDTEVHGFSGRNRAGKVVDELIVHESVTRSVADTVSVLKRRALGVHLIIGPDGEVSQHADLAHTQLSHALGHNERSVAIEVVNPYYPPLLREDLPWQQVIDAPWAHRGAYVLPTRAQVEALAILIAWLSRPDVRGLEIPRRWIGLSQERMRLGLVTGSAQAAPGLYAHHYIAHADGAWPLLYAWLRLEAGLGPEEAYAVAIERASGHRVSVDLSDLYQRRESGEV